MSTLAAPPPKILTTPNGERIEVGGTVGKLVLTSFYDPPQLPFDPPGKRRPRQWMASCACGNETRTEEYKLANGSVFACAECIKRLKNRQRRREDKGSDPTKNPPGEGVTVGKLTLLKQVDGDKWECQCSCGKIVVLKEKSIYHKYRPIVKCADCAAPPVEPTSDE